MTKISERDMMTNYTTNFPQWYEWNYNDPVYGHNFPLWRANLVPMMQRDPRIRYGLQLLKGPICSFTAFYPEDKADNPQIHETIREQGVQFVYGVRCKNKEAQEFILKSLAQFWKCGVEEALLAIDWGFSCSQVFYKRSKAGKIEYDRLAHINPYNLRPYINARDEILGCKIRGVPGYPDGFHLPFFKILWHRHCKEVHYIYGESRLKWAFVPWHETWTQYGARDIRRTWFQRNAYDGGTMFYPPGKSETNAGQVDHRDLATQYMTQMRTGGFRILPNEFMPDGKTPKWNYEAPAANITPQGLMEYPEVLRHEILEALGIPPEVVESSSDSGFGSATGRKVPMMVYYSTLQVLVNQLITDFERFVLRTLLIVNNFGNDDYEIYKVTPLESQDTKADPTTKTVGDTGLSV